MIYIIGGPGKTGSSAISSRLSREFNILRYYGGGYLRYEALKAGCVKNTYKIPQNPDLWDLDMADIKGFRAYCTETQRDIDMEMDLYLLEGMVRSITDGTDIIIESKVMARLMHSDIFLRYLDTVNRKLFTNEKEYISKDQLHNSTISIWLHSDIRTRALRVLNKRKVHKSNGSSGYTESQIEAEIEDLSTRQAVDKADYVKKYDMLDFPDASEAPKNELYGIIIDNSNQTEEETYNKVKEVLNLFN